MNNHFVPTSEPEKWFAPAPAARLEDIAGMEELKQRLRSEAVQLASGLRQKLFPGSCAADAYVFYSAPGSGRGYLCQAFARELVDHGFQYLRLRSEDILSCYVGEAEKRVELAFRAAVDHAPCVLHIEDLERLCRSRSTDVLPGHVHRLTCAVLMGYSAMRDSGRQVVLIAETGEPWRVDEALLDKSILVRVPRPDRTARAALFERCLSRVRLEEGLSFDALAERTEGRCYQEVRRVAQHLMRKVADACAQRIDALRGSNPDADGQQLAAMAIAEVERGRICVTRAMMEAAFQECPPIDWTSVDQSLEQFEDRCKM